MQRAILLVVLADLWWGISAIYWNELDTVDPLDQLGWRISLGLLTMVLYWLLCRRWPLPTITRRHVLFGAVGALCVSSNWAVFLWAIANEQAVGAALGYFLMPIISVALAVLFLGEYLRPLQGVAVVLAAVGLTWLIVLQGGVPWVAVVLGVSFSLYGITRKIGPWGALEGLTVEMAFVAPIGIALLAIRFASGERVEGDGALTTWLLISVAGLATVVPLVLFANAARKAPLVVVGLLQYVIPVAQFLVGWLVLDESVSAGRFAGFSFIWVALALVMVDQFGSQSPVDRLAARLHEGSVRPREGPAPEEPPIRRQR